MPVAPPLANIDEAGKRRRVAIGLVLADGAVVAAIVLVAVGVDRWWRLTLFVPFFIGVLCLLQARANC